MTYSVPCAWCVTTITPKCSVSWPAALHHFLPDFLNIFNSRTGSKDSFPPCKRKTLQGGSLQKLLLLQIQWCSDSEGSFVFIWLFRTPPCKCLILDKATFFLFFFSFPAAVVFTTAAVIGKGKYKYSPCKETLHCHPSSKHGTDNALGSPLSFPAAYFWGWSLSSGTSFTTYCPFHISFSIAFSLLHAFLAWSLQKG